jgi:hypothetical protein
MTTRSAKELVMKNIFRHKITEEEAIAAVYAAVATEEEKRIYQQFKAREARESQARWSKHQRWDR